MPDLCSVCGTETPPGKRRRGMCKKHYERWRIHGDPTVVLLDMPDDRGTPRHGTPSCYTSGCRCDECRTANRAYLRSWRARNPDKVRNQNAQWKTNNPAEARLWEWVGEQRRRGLPATEESTAYARVLFGDPCSYCGAPPSRSIDHIVAQSEGGTGDWTNLTAACGSCNSRKHAKPLLRFMLAEVSSGG